MNVRKFIAPTITEALAEVKKELGDEAIILRTKTVRKQGMMSFLAKDAVEIMAASPDRNPPETPEVKEQVAEVRRRLSQRPSDAAVTELKDELSELKGHLREIAEQVKFERMPALPAVLGKYFRELVTSGVDPRFAAELTEQLNLHHSADSLENSGLVERDILAAIARRIKVRKPHTKSDGRARIIAFIGPTGVGKTTTLAKLATSYRYWGGSNTAIVSADTYRVAALEQIKTFAAIAGLPMEAVYQPEAMPTALSRHMHREAIFIDTPGRSQSDSLKLDELSAFLDSIEAGERFLCLAINTRSEDQLDILERYSRLKPTGIIFTKLDDSSHPGGVMTVAEKCDIPLTYLTCGQNVPDDIISATPERIAELLLHPLPPGHNHQKRFESWIATDEQLARGEQNGG